MSFMYYFKNDSGNPETLHLNSVMPFLGIKSLLHGSYRCQQPHLRGPHAEERDIIPHRVELTPNKSFLT